MAEQRGFDHEAARWAVVNSKLADNSVNNRTLQAGAVSSSVIADAQVTAAKIADGAVVNSKIADTAVSTRTIQNWAVTSAAIADGAVQTMKVADGQITTSKLVDGAVSTPKLQDGAIQDRHIGILSKLTASDGNPANAVLVDALGNVGIGTTTPAAKLDVAGALKIVGMAQQSLGPNGYIQIGELIIQWGQESPSHDINSASTTTLSFPKPFPNAVFVVVPGIMNDPGYGMAVTLMVQNITQSQATFRWDEWASSNVQRVRASYIAIGR